MFFSLFLPAFFSLKYQLIFFKEKGARHYCKTPFNCPLYSISAPPPINFPSPDNQSNHICDTNLIRTVPCSTFWRLATSVRINCKGLTRPSSFCKIWHLFTPMNSPPSTLQSLTPIQSNWSLADFQKCQAQSYLRPFEYDVPYPWNILSPHVT